jgi:hypothetical protein
MADIEIPASSGMDALDAASAEIRSSSPVAARLEVAGGADSWSVDARPAPAAQTRIFVPHFEWNGAFKARLILLNTASSAQDARLTARTAAGAEAAPKSVMLVQPNSVSDTPLESLLGSAAQAGGSGWVEIENPGGALLGALLVYDPASGAAASAPLGSSSGSWNLPYVVENRDFWTGLAVATPSPGDATVTLTAYGPAGAVLASASTVLKPYERLTALLSQWLPPLNWNASGYLTVTGTSGITALSYFGTADGRSVATIPLGEGMKE